MNSVLLPKSMWENLTHGSGQWDLGPESMWAISEIPEVFILLTLHLAPLCGGSEEVNLPGPTSLPSGQGLKEATMNSGHPNLYLQSWLCHLFPYVRFFHSLFSSIHKPPCSGLSKNPGTVAFKAHRLMSFLSASRRNLLQCNFGQLRGPSSRG